MISQSVAIVSQFFHIANIPDVIMLINKEVYVGEIIQKGELRLLFIFMNF